jgi:hypothetical protein
LTLPCSEPEHQLTDALLQVAGMKKLLNRHFGYGSLPRRPLLEMGDEQFASVLSSEHFNKLLELEESLKSGGR